MEPVGRLINPVLVADNRYVSLKDCRAVTFLCFLDGGDTYTLTEATDASGTGAQVLATIERYYTSNGIGGVWTERTQAAASTVVTPDTAIQDGMVFTVTEHELSAGYDYIKVASTGAGTVVAIAHDLQVQRAPELLVSLTA